MPRKNQPTDDQIRNIYHNNYIGRSESATQCADHLDITSNTFTNRCQKLSLPNRTRSEAYQARKQIGQPWIWPNDPKPAPTSVKPPPPEPVEGPPVGRSEGQPKKPYQTPMIISSHDFVPALPDRPQWLTNHPAQSKSKARLTPHDIINLTEDLIDLGAKVSIQLNITLEQPQ